MCMALAEHLGLSSLTPSEWAAIAKERGAPSAQPLEDLVEEEDFKERLERLAKSNAALLDQNFGGRARPRR